MDADRLLDGLDREQRVAVTIEAGPLAIVAPAGSGKTRVLTRRIGHRVATGRAQPDHVLVLTFTRRAARELEHRLDELGMGNSVTAGTFHAVAWASLQRRFTDTRRRAPTLLDRPDQLVAELVGRRSLRAADILGDISWAQSRLVGPGEFEIAARQAGKYCSAPTSVVAELYAAYEQRKKQRKVIDFADLLTDLTQLLIEDPAFAEVEQWRFRHLFVDEFQDLNPAQHALLEAWRSGREDLCVVGDPHQAIYGWNGADPSFLDRFADHYPGATIVSLETNYRTPAPILHLAERVLGSVNATASRDDGEEPRLVAFDDETDEAHGVAGLVSAEHEPGRRWSSIAVLARTNAQLELLQRAFDARGIPNRLRMDRAAIRSRSVNEWLRTNGERSLRDAVDLLEETMTPGDESETMTDDPLEVILTSGRRFLDRYPYATVASFAPWFVAAGDDERSAKGDAVELATFHAAKGLEWHSVFVVGMEDGLVPINGARGAAKDEERRLAYVALTRARHQLTVSWARSRNGSPRQRSIYLPDTEAPMVAAPPLRLPRRDHPPDRSSLIRSAVRSWREREARPGLADPRAVITDDAIEQVASLDEGSLDQIASIIGPVKHTRYGSALVTVVRSALGEHAGEP